MIEFSGHLTGDAEIFFWNNSRKIAFIFFSSALAFFLPVIIAISFFTHFWLLAIAYIGIYILSIPFLFIPKTKKGKNPVLTKRIYIDEEYIVWQSEEREEYNLISDASKVVDYGSFYHISFPFGKISDKFICQKSLLTKGTIEDFEALFEDKIISKAKK